MVVEASTWRRTLKATGLAIGLSLSLLNTAVAQTIRGVVTPFGEQMYRRYFEEYERETGVKVKYVVRSSSGGIDRFIEGIVDFVASDAPPTAAETSQMKRGYLLLPSLGSGVAVIYKLRDAPPDIRISRETLVNIFTGKIGNWNQVSPRLPNQKIQVVVHDKGSGTNFLFTRHLSAITNGEIETTKDPEWGFNVFASRDGDAAVASTVGLTDGAISYVETNYALREKLFIARLQNQAGEYVHPTLENTHKALLSTEWSDDFTLKYIDDPREGYPIVGASFMLFYEEYPNTERAQAIKDLVSWIVTKGLNMNEDLYYSAPSPPERPKLRDNINDNIRISP